MAIICDAHRKNIVELKKIFSVMLCTGASTNNPPEFLKRVPAECSNAFYCESSANKTSCMSS